MTFSSSPPLVATLARLVAAGALAVIAGCSSVNSMMGGNSERDALSDLTWSYSADGVRLSVTADNPLNPSGGQSHTLLVAVVQMADPNAFTTFSASSDKLSELLLADAPPTGMLSLQRLYIEPGSERNITLPRVEKARYVGVAAGYFHLDPTRSTRLYRIGVDVSSSGWVVKNRSASPEPLQIDLQLGADGIAEGSSRRAFAPDPERPVGGLVAPAH
jgi:type VI secretion system VasD/TssJ family lipoprotein